MSSMIFALFVIYNWKIIFFNHIIDFTGYIGKFTKVSKITSALNSVQKSVTNLYATLFGTIFFKNKIVMCNTSCLGRILFDFHRASTFWKSSNSTLTLKIYAILNQKTVNTYQVFITYY